MRSCLCGRTRTCGWLAFHVFFFNPALSKFTQDWRTCGKAVGFLRRPRHDHDDLAADVVHIRTKKSHCRSQGEGLCATALTWPRSTTVPGCWRRPCHRAALPRKKKLKRAIESDDNHYEAPFTENVLVLITDSESDADHTQPAHPKQPAINKSNSEASSSQLSSPLPKESRHTDL